MPGAKTEEDEMREFAEAVARGDTFEADPDEVRAFRRALESAFGNVKPPEEALISQSKAGSEPRRQPQQPQHTNAIAGERPGRGVR